MDASVGNVGVLPKASACGPGTVACTEFLKGRGGKKKKRAHIAHPHHCTGQFSTRFGSQEGL